MRVWFTIIAALCIGLALDLFVNGGQVSQAVTYAAIDAGRTARGEIQGMVHAIGL